MSLYDESYETHTHTHTHTHTQCWQSTMLLNVQEVVQSYHCALKGWLQYIYWRTYTYLP